MAKLFTTGPALMYIAAPQPLFLGTAESPPDIDLTSAFTPVMNDMGGTVLPMDRIYEGEEAVISFVLNRWNEAALQVIQSIYLGKTIGRETFGDLGSMIGQEDLTYAFYMLFPFQQKPIYSEMPPGYRFFSCFRIGNQGVRPGTRAKAHHLMLKAQRYSTMRPNIGNTLATTLSTVTSSCYDFNVSAVATIPID